jgi:hypothetical protein
MDTEFVQAPKRSSQRTAFVDASVIAAYLKGEEAAARLFKGEYRHKIQFAVDPVVSVGEDAR